MEAQHSHQVLVDLNEIQLVLSEAIRNTEGHLNLLKRLQENVIWTRSATPSQQPEGSSGDLPLKRRDNP